MASLKVDIKHIKLTRKIKIILLILGITFVSFSIFKFDLIGKIVININPSEKSTYIINYYIEDCKSCPPSFPRYFLNINCLNCIQYSEIILPGGLRGVLPPISNDITLTIGYCFCYDEEVIFCTLFHQYKIEEKIPLNYSVDLSNIKCIPKPVPT